MKYRDVLEEAYNIYNDPRCDIADVGNFLDEMVEDGNITSHQAMNIMSAVFDE